MCLNEGEVWRKIFSNSIIIVTLVTRSLPFFFSSASFCVSSQLMNSLFSLFGCALKASNGFHPQDNVE